MDKNYSRMTEAEKAEEVEMSSDQDLVFENADDTSDWMDRVIEKVNEVKNGTHRYTE
jgi:hypothetical protein